MQDPPPERIVHDLTMWLPYAQWIADQRHEQKKDQPWWTPFNAEYGTVGVLGEIVFSLSTGLPARLDVLEGGATDGGVDFGRDIDVKTIRMPGGVRHIVEHTYKKIPPRYVLCVVNLDQRQGWVEGWCTGDEFIAKHTLHDFGYGERKVLHQMHLDPPWTLPELVIHSCKVLRQHVPIVNEARQAHTSPSSPLSTHV
jgi:hypothetical protein